MFSITVALAHTTVIWTFMYKTKETAEAASQLICKTANPLHTQLEIHDDFGQFAMIPGINIAGALFEDLEQSKMAHIERAMHTERVKIQANNAAQADPQIKTAMRNQQRSPAIFDPTQNGGGPPRF